MASTPIAVEVRGYQVGFGDCFLVSFVYPKNQQRHVLIDFGTTELPKGLAPSKYMPKVADSIKDACAGKLSAVVATHRHADHISGFATDSRSGESGKIIAACKPKLVLQPWTEDPRAAKDAKRATANSSRTNRGFVAGLSAMHDVASEILAIGLDPPRNISAATAKQLRFLGMDNIKNRSAVENLIRMGKAGTAVWAHHGSRSGLERLLPGVKVRVLGPPDLTQTEKIRRMTPTDPDEFWQLLGGPKALGTGRVRSKANGHSRIPLPADARWFSARLSAMTNEQLLEIVRVLDDQMNNTSLILLFEVGNKKLLFPGDAQIENWSYALEDAPDAKATRKLLAGVDLYKVGHHGSRNATPKELLWESFTKRSATKGKRLRTMLSTLPGKHGTPGKHTEVPRATLLDALKDETELLDTHALPKGELFQLMTLTV